MRGGYVRTVPRARAAARLSWAPFYPLACAGQLGRGSNPRVKQPLSSPLIRWAELYLRLACLSAMRSSSAARLAAVRPPGEFLTSAPVFGHGAKRHSLVKYVSREWLRGGTGDDDQEPAEQSCNRSRAGLRLSECCGQGHPRGRRPYGVG